MQRWRLHEKFCESLREHATKKINFKKKKVKLLTKEQQKSYGNAQICYICICIYINVNLDKVIKR